MTSKIFGQKILGQKKSVKNPFFEFQNLPKHSGNDPEQLWKNWFSPIFVRKSRKSPKILDFYRYFSIFWCFSCYFRWFPFIFVEFRLFSLNSVYFHWFPLIFVYFHWFPLIFAEFHYSSSVLVWKHWFWCGKKFCSKTHLNWRATAFSSMPRLARRNFAYYSIKIT